MKLNLWNLMKTEWAGGGGIGGLSDNLSALCKIPKSKSRDLG